MSYPPEQVPAQPYQYVIPAQAPQIMPGPPASLGNRLLARLIDLSVYLISYVAYLILTLLVGAHLVGAPNVGHDEVSPAGNAVFVIATIGLYAFLFLYEFLFIAKNGQTLGKRSRRIRVVRFTNSTGRPGWTQQVGYGAAAIRVFIPIIAWCIPVLGLLFWISPLFDSSEWRRGWADKMAHTVVIDVLNA